jgi:hypothetical protein
MSHLLARSPWERFDATSSILLALLRSDVKTGLLSIRLAADMNYKPLKVASRFSETVHVQH